MDKSETCGEKINIGDKELFEIYGNNGNVLMSYEFMMNPSLSPIDAERWALDSIARSKLEKLDRDGTVQKVGIVSGSFDVPQENHDWFLRHCRLLLAERYLRDNCISNTKENLSKTIESDDIMLIVSVDSDKVLDNNKSGKIEKGGVKRPIYNWLSRASRIGMCSFESNYKSHHRVSVVDLVIAEGPEYEGTTLREAGIFADMAKNCHGLIDEFIVFTEHDHDLNSAVNAGFEPIIIPKELVYARDSNGNRISSSAIINRIREGK